MELKIGLPFVLEHPELQLKEVDRDIHVQSLDRALWGILFLGLYSSLLMTFPRANVGVIGHNQEPGP